MAKPICFVIMPFGKKDKLKSPSFDEIYEKLFAPVIKNKLGYECKRADLIWKEYDLLKNILTDLICIENLVVADLTGDNANVFYELGIRHAIAPSRTILLAQEGWHVKSDLSSRKYIPYNPNINDEMVLRKSQESLEMNMLYWINNTGDEKPDSPLFGLFPQILTCFHDRKRLKTENEDLNKLLAEKENEIVNMQSYEAYEAVLERNKLLDERLNEEKNLNADLIKRIADKLSSFDKLDKSLFDLLIFLKERKNK